MLVAQEVLEAVVQVKLVCRILPGGQIQVAGGSRCQPLLTPQPRTHERLQHAPAGSLPAPTRSGVPILLSASPLAFRFHFYFFSQLQEDEIRNERQDGGSLRRAPEARVP